MPTGAVLLVRMQRPLGESELGRLRELFLAENRLCEDDFYPGGPLILVRNPQEGPMPIRDRRSLWLNTNIHGAYFGLGYERGDVDLLTGCAAWLESHVPDGEVWYGHDVNDDNLRPCGPDERRSLLRLRPSRET